MCQELASLATALLQKVPKIEQAKVCRPLMRMR